MWAKPFNDLIYPAGTSVMGSLCWWACTSAIAIMKGSNPNWNLNLFYIMENIKRVVRTPKGSMEQLKLQGGKEDGKNYGEMNNFDKFPKRRYKSLRKEEGSLPKFHF